MKVFRNLKNSSKGFAHLELVLGVLVILVVGAVGARVMFGSHAATPPANGILSVGQTLTAGQDITSKNGYSLDMQTDGNLVVYGIGNQGAIWSSKTSGTGNNNSLVMQTDGNLVVYTAAGKAVWSSGTGGTGSNNQAVMQPDGNLVVYTAAGKAVWNSGTSSYYIYPSSWQNDHNGSGTMSLVNDGTQGQVLYIDGVTTASLQFSQFPALYNLAVAHANQKFQICFDIKGQTGYEGQFLAANLSDGIPDIDIISPLTASYHNYCATATFADANFLQEYNGKYIGLGINYYSGSVTGYKLYVSSVVLTVE